MGFEQASGWPIVANASVSVSVSVSDNVGDDESGQYPGVARRGSRRDDPAMERQASCSCGGFKVTCEVDPVRVSVCHCLECQRRTGSAFGAQGRFPKDRVRVEGAFREFKRRADSGNDVTFRFCPTCGSTVCWELNVVPGFVAIALGAFADPTFPAPTFSIYEARKHAWFGFTSAIEHMD